MKVGIDTPVSRREALRLGGGVAAGLVGAGALLDIAGVPVLAATSGDNEGSSPLPVQQMEDIMETEATVDGGVVFFEISRDDMGTHYINGVPVTPDFEINGTVAFQPLSGGQAFFNGDTALKPSEVDPFIDAILANGLTFQAEHQHFYDLTPPVWFIHWRGRGDALDLTRRVRNCFRATSAPFPQPSTSDTTPLDPERLRSILHGYESEVSNGVVTVYVARRDPIYIDGVRVQPQTNIATNISFEPLNSSGSDCAVAPDFAMEASEINNLVRVMRANGWDIGCLYNQETDEHPQLFFSHQFKTGDPYTLAHQVRLGLNQTNSY